MGPNSEWDSLGGSCKIELKLDLGPQESPCEVVGSVTLSVKPDPMCGAAGHPTETRLLLN